jgi:CHASE3 domain sensor protein
VTEAERTPTLSKRLFWALVTPVALLVVVGTVLGAQLFRMASDAHAVDHSDQVVAAANDALKHILDQETGLRGYLVTRDPIFLEPFEHARVTQALDSLSDQVADNPTQLRRVEEMRRRYQRWILSAEPAAHDLSKFEESRLLDSMFVRKKEMDAIRESLRAFIESEHELRHERAVASAKSYDTTRFSLVALVLLASVVLGVVSRRQLSAIAESYGVAMDKELAAKRLMEDETWVRTGQAVVATSFQGDRSLAELGERGLRALAEHVGADVGALFTAEGGRWTRCAGFGVDGATEGSFAKGEGLVGRAALRDEVLHVTDVPNGYLKVRSGTGESDVTEILLAPAFTDGQSFAVVELGFLRKVEPKTKELLDRVGDAVAVAVRSAEYKARLRDLLEESQRQGEELQAQQEELQAQQEELRVANEELEEQSNALREANARSEERQEELVTVNSRLSEQQAALVAAQQRVLEKAEEAERASRT